MMIKFSTTFHLLQQEGYLIHSSLLSGLHYLRNARLDTKGHFYTAFFQLSVGLERMMKATFIINYMRENRNATPSNQQLRRFGHELTVLFDSLAMLSLPGCENPLLEIDASSVERMILEALSEFANGARYHNLDSLAARARFNDPLETWNAVIERVMREDLRRADVERVLHQSQMLARAIGGSSIFVGSDLRKHPLNALTAFSLPRYHNMAAGHVVNHTMVLIRALARQLDDVSHLVLIDPRNDRDRPMPIPHMNEFFNFVHYERKQILRKRRWP